MDNEWIRNIVKIATQAVEESAPCDVIFGTVLSSEPKIQIDQKTILEPSLLVLSQAVKNHQKTMSIPGVGTVTVTILGALKAGEKVIMMQEKGGQRFTVIDRY